MGIVDHRIMNDGTFVLVDDQQRGGQVHDECGLVAVAIHHGLVRLRSPFSKDLAGTGAGEIGWSPMRRTSVSHVVGRP